MKLELNFSEWLLFEGKNPIRQGEIEIYGDTYNKKEEIKRVTHGNARYSGERTWYVPAEYRRAILALGGLMVSGDPTPQQRPQLRPQAQVNRPQLARPENPQAQPTLTSTGKPKPKWYYAKVMRADPRFPEGKEIAVTPAKDDKSVWEYVVLDKRFSRRFGTITKEEIDGGLIKTVRRDDKPVATEKPNFKGFREAFNLPEEKTKKLQEIPEHMLSGKQKQIDKKFASIMGDDKQNHIVISALAGTGKTTCLKHLAWKYAKPGQRWLYLVFNTKNKVEAKEPGEFPPQPLVTIKTTNGFLGNVIEGTEPGTEANKLKLKQTERVVDIVKGLRKEDNEEQDEKKLEKIRIISDGSQFEAILLDKTKAPKGYDASDDYDKWVAKAVNARIRQIRYLFKEESIRLANLAKSYAVDPRDQQKTMQLLETILDEHNIDVTFIDEKVKISKYKGNMPRYVANALKQILGYDFMQKNYSEEIKYAAYWLLQQSMPGASSQEYQRGGISHPMGKFRDFSDDIWFASTYADEIDWPKYDVVLADEVQDFNESQKIMLKKLGEQGAKIVAVGDKNQSIYRFRGADSEAFDNLSASLAHWSSNKDDVVQTISDNFRSKQAIIDKSNTTHVQNLKKSDLKNYDEEGHVTEGEKKYEEAFGDIKKEFDVTGEIKTTAFISRTNEPLIHAALQLLKRGIPFVILGKDIAGGLRKHIAKISAFKDVNDSSECGELQSQLEGYLNQENDLYHGTAVKRGYLQELKEVTEAIISSISQFLEEGEGGNNTVGSFKKWIMDKLGKATLDFDTGSEQAKERDYAKYKKKMEEETPPVVLTTSHKSKGLQFSRVYILRYDLFPHPKTRKDRPKEVVQEENARYVSITRAQDELHILDLEGQPGYKKKQGNAMEWTEWFRLRDL